MGKSFWTSNCVSPISFFSFILQIELLPFPNFDSKMSILGAKINILPSFIIFGTLQMPRQNQITVLRQIYLVLTKNDQYYDTK
jgi:hypothetical protein